MLMLQASKHVCSIHIFTLAVATVTTAAGRVKGGVIASSQSNRQRDGKDVDDSFVDEPNIARVRPPGNCVSLNSSSNLLRWFVAASEHIDTHVCFSFSKFGLLLLLCFVIAVVVASTSTSTAKHGAVLFSRSHRQGGDAVADDSFADEPSIARVRPPGNCVHVFKHVTVVY